MLLYIRINLYNQNEVYLKKKKIYTLNRFPQMCYVCDEKINKVIASVFG